MNEFNDLNYMRQKYQLALDNNIQKLQGRLKTLNSNINKQQNATSRQQITMIKNPSEIKSLRSSCLLTENNLASPSERFESSIAFANFNRQSSLEVCQAIQGLQQKTLSPDVFENVYLKQSYLPYDHKSTKGGQFTAKTNSQTLKTTKSPPKQSAKSQSLSTINDHTQKRIIAKRKKQDKVVFEEVIKTKISSRSPNKKKKITPANLLLRKPINEIIKKYIKSKFQKSRTASKSKSKSKSPPKEINSKKKKSKGRKRNDAVHLDTKQSPQHYSPKVTKFQVKEEKENSPVVLRLIRTLSKKKNTKPIKLTSPNKVQEINSQRLKNLIPKKQKQKQFDQQNTNISKRKQKQFDSAKKEKVIQFISVDDNQKDESKSSSLRLNTFSIQKSCLSDEPQQKQLLSSIYLELKQLSESQMQELKNYLSNYKSERKDEALQTSINNEFDTQPKSSPKQGNMIESHWKMAQEEGYPKLSPIVPQHQAKILISNNQIEELCSQREQGIKLRVNSQIQAFQTLLQQQKISPRSFHQNKQLLQSWSLKQSDQLNRLRQELFKAQKASQNLIRRTENDLMVASELKQDQMLVLTQLQQISFDQSEIREESQLDQSDIQFSLPNSPKIETPPTSKRLEQKQQQQPQQQALRNPIVDFRRKDLSLQNFMEDTIVPVKQLQVSPDNESNQIISAKIKNTLNSKVDQISLILLQQLIDETSNSFHRIGGTQNLIQQINNEQELVESQIMGIRTNVGVVNDYINKLCAYIIETYLDEFIQRINYPYGRMPHARLRDLHGYGYNSGDQRDEIDYPIQQYIFTELQQQLQSESNYEQPHNQAIFNCFNETLNQFRPFYQVDGLPFPWTYSYLTVIIINRDNLHVLFERAKQKVIEYASSLCGLLSDEETIQCVKLNYQQILHILQNQENDCLTQLREERLNKVMEIENMEQEYVWHLYEDKKAEALMELSDVIFEEMIDEFTQEFK